MAIAASASLFYLVHLNLEHIWWHAQSKGHPVNLKGPRLVLKVVNNLESSCKCVEQNPFFPSFLLKYFAPDKLWLISSRVGGLQYSLMIALVRSLASRQMLSMPSTFSGYVSEDIKGVRATEGEFTPNLHILFNFSSMDSQFYWNVSAGTFNRMYIWVYGYMVVTRHVAYCVERVWKSTYQTLYGNWYVT